MKLVTLSGNRISNTRRENSKDLKNVFAQINPEELNPIERGFYTLKLLTEFYPNVTWGELLKAGHDFKSGKLLSGNWFTRSMGYIGDGLSDGIDKLGEISGDAVRLITDKEVAGSLMEGTAAYFSGGASLGAKGLFGGALNEEQSRYVTEAFGQAKANPLPWIVGGIGGLALLILLLKK